MKFKVLFLCVLFSACNGSLTDEQRKKAKADIELNQIKKISDSEITDAAFVYGRHVVDLLTITDSQSVQDLQDSLQQSFHVRIKTLRTSDAVLSEKEKLIVEAYEATPDQNDLSDNVQKVNADSVLYTKPIVKKNSNGSTSFDYAIGIVIPKKEIVLSIKN